MFSCPSPAFGGRIQQPLVVVLVATHADLADIPRAFSGEFTYDKEKVLLKEVRNRSGPQRRSNQILLKWLLPSVGLQTQISLLCSQVRG